MKQFMFAVFLLPLILRGQINTSQQKALNASVEYANQSAERVNSIVKSIIEAYPQMQRKSTWPKYVCPAQIDDYYLTQALNQTKAFSEKYSVDLNSSLQSLKRADEQLDKSCKALDTYYKLEDYKSDNFQKARMLVNDIQQGVAAYKKESVKLNMTLRSIKKELDLARSPYNQADAKMLAVIEDETYVLDLWNFNLDQEVHTGWPDEKIKQSIVTSDQSYSNLRSQSFQLKYPASSMWSHFQESLSSIIEIKKRSIDDYNFEAKKSDKHSNDFYLEFINYFNGTLVADYNTFIQFAERDGYLGLKALNYISSFEIRSEPKSVKIEVAPFKDVIHSTLFVKNEKLPISSDVFVALSNYVELINETWRQTNYLQLVLRSFNSSASSFKNLENYDRRAPMHFDYSDFKLPQSQYQTTIRSSYALQPTYSKVLNEQVEVIMSILKEMDGLAASLDVEVKGRKYESDHLANIYKILERQSVLFKIWDEKKEALYNDVRAVYNSFPPVTPESSWQISGKVLRTLSDLDHDVLFQAKAFYNEDSTITIQTDKVDEMVREVISKEYDNMKGIQKIGRNNGLCPYTPYEDLPETSRRLSEASQKLKPAKNLTGYSHPYHSLVYMYNDIVDDYNKFCELSTTVLHLKTIKQPELFSVAYPQARSGERKPEGANTQATTHPKNDAPEVVRAKKDDVPPGTTINNNQKETLRDTVYITKRDTVFIAEPAENLRSMEGYATNNLILLLDVSGSMNQQDKLPLLKRSMLDLISMMREEDKISIITFSGKPKLVLKSSSFKEEEKIKKSVSDLSSSGKTDGNAAIRLAYKVADENYLRGGNNRIVLATDGDFTLNENIVQLIEKFSKEDIFLSIFNFGKGMGASKNLERLATLGKGNFSSISKENVDMKLIREVKAKKK